MEPNDPVWWQPSRAHVTRRRDAGAIIRIARLAKGLTLAELGRRCGYSASQISRYERGVQPLTDIVLLRRFAEVLAIPPQAFGLAPPDGERAGRHTPLTGSKAHRVGIDGPNVAREFQREDSEDPVRRRELLASAAGLAGTAALGLRATARTQTLGDPAGGLEDLLYGDVTAEPVTLDAVRAAANRARDAFQTAHYDRLAADLPALIATATATRDHAESYSRASANDLVADAYIVATNFMVKLNDDPLAWTTADRALQAALLSGDPLTIADARRSIAIVLRRTGRAAKAQHLLISAAHDIEPSGHTSPDQLSMYGTLLEVAAYTAAVDGNRRVAGELIGEAKAAADRLGRDANHRYTAFGPTNVALYQVSIAQVLGDSGTAIEHAKTLRRNAIPTHEREGRYWIDVARAYHQWGKLGPCYRALLSAERAAPAEVRYRPPVRRMTEGLLRADRRRSLPGLRAFAHRVGVPA